MVEVLAQKLQQPGRLATTEDNQLSITTKTVCGTAGDKQGKPLTSLAGLAISEKGTGAIVIIEDEVVRDVCSGVSDE